MGKHVVCRTSELPLGERMIVTLEGRSVGIFNVNNEYYSLKNTCPHHSAPLCKGRVTGMTLPSQPGTIEWVREGEIIRCPWHYWEFDIKTGKSIFDPHKLLVKTYEVTVEKEQPEQSEESESVESYPVTVESDLVVVHI